METRSRIIENWLTKTRHHFAAELTYALVGVLFLGSFLYLSNSLHAAAWMPATAERVFGQGEYYRLFTTLLAHGDLGHVLANLILFVPFAYFLSAHFSPLFFPGLGILGAALSNLLVLKTLPPGTQLIGASGLVYWMGGAWLTFFLAIDRREKLGRRLGKAFLVALVLFVPETVKPEVSYLAHAWGFLLGVLTAAGAYLLNRKKIQAAEVTELVVFALPEDSEEYREDAV